jgi:hypothetical protein
MYVTPFREVTSMVRMFTAAALVVLSTSAFAQFMEPVKGIKYGDGCIGPVSTYAARLGACAIADTKSRIWCTASPRSSVRFCFRTVIGCSPDRPVL